jgi:succinate dehydrogenase / fumarate reductase membrane anchor subunit
MLIELLTKRYPGMRAWLTQRFTAIVMAIFCIFAVIRFLIVQPSDYVAWLSFNQPLWWRLASWLFWVALSLHAWLGIRDVFKDYVPKYAIRTVLVNVLFALLWIYLVWITYLFLF